MALSISKLTEEVSTVLVPFGTDKLSVTYKSSEYSPAFIWATRSLSQGQMLARILTNIDLELTADDLEARIDVCIAGLIKEGKASEAKELQELRPHDASPTELVRLPVNGHLLDTLGIKILNKIIVALGRDCRPNFEEETESPSENSW